MVGVATAPFRPAGPADVPALAALYARCAREMGPQVYSAEQVRAWVGFGADTPVFRDYVLQARTWIASASGGEGEVLGFCGIGPEGEVHSLYVRPDRGRCGLGGALLAHAMADARSHGVRQFGAWATPFSRRLFQRAGLPLVRTVVEDFGGALFERYRMGRG
jgi:GNAT superfamily N-acetyltransferase